MKDEKNIYFFAHNVFLVWLRYTPFYKKVVFELEPDCEYQRDSSVDFNKYNSFSLIKLKGDTSDINPLTGKQISFMLRNKLEMLGYKYTTDYENADFIVVPYFPNEYKSIYVAPSSYTIPQRISGQTLTTNYNFYGDITARGTATTKTSDQYVPTTFTSPASNEGYFFPFIQLFIYDNKTKSLVWSGTICNATKESDIRLSAQSLMDGLLFGKKSESNFPKNNNCKFKSRDGELGIQVVVWTLDGNNFYPYISGTVAGLSAQNAKLKVSDIIVMIDGKNTLNLSLFQVVNALDKNKGESATLTIKRDSKIFVVNLIAK